MTERFDEDGISPANEESGLEQGGTRGPEGHYNLPVPFAGTQAAEEETAPPPYEQFLKQIRATLPDGYAMDIERKVIVSIMNNAVVCGLICPVLHVRDPRSGHDWPHALSSSITMERCGPQPSMTPMSSEKADTFRNSAGRGCMWGFSPLWSRGSSGNGCGSHRCRKGGVSIGRAG